MKTVFHYLFLATMPILGILGLLHLGSRLQAPASIGGEWQLELTPSAINEAGCATLPDAAVQPSLEILQSGTHLILELNIGEEMSLRGRLDELTITTDPDRCYSHRSPPGGLYLSQNPPAPSYGRNGSWNPTWPILTWLDSP